jgi:hypothetical protein
MVWRYSVRTPLRVSLVAASVVFLAALLAGLFHGDSINGHILTPLEELPLALIVAILFSALAVLGTWLGMRRASLQHLSCRSGLALALLYVAATFVANATIHAAPRTEVIPSHEATIQGLKDLIFIALWGIGAPYLIALLFRRFKAPRGLGGA